MMLREILIIGGLIVGTFVGLFGILWFYEEIINGGSYSPRG